MTFDEAMQAAKEGKAVRHNGMTASDSDRAANWSLVEGWGTYG